ncbi:Solute-binding protein [Koleobacter methoxysyntrophicus]|uniref:Solute-binding protein n=1 Tax=Koleobacter methoxysyntrophicus TaxID=2751313 RepID=A0A8A0RKY7_9FIRM|nr:DctP family TRAP transporter solute-binding subunit [Koleobacter methoxysyntrophicus]QSQ08290.1 Solute-binding protein [Koleobacter methoxysyntrophicus]
MKKVLILLSITVICLGLILTGCGGKQGDSKPDDAANKPITIKLAYVVPETQSTHIASEKVFKNYVEEKSGGRLKVELYPNGQLGSDRQAIEGVSLGTIEMTIPAAAVLSGFEEKFMVFDLPFLFESREAAHRALDGELGQKLSELLIPHGLKNLVFAENGFRNITNNKKPITTPDDLKGLKIRTMENPVHIAAFKALGANPTPMAFGELFTALQQGTVDAQENPISLIYTSKFYEVQKYCTLSGHVYAPTAVLINNDFYNSLPEDLQKIIREAAVAYRDYQRELAGQQDTEFIAKLKEAGMQVNELTPEQKKAFVEATKVVYEQFESKIGKDLIEMARAANK